MLLHYTFYSRLMGNKRKLLDTNQCAAPLHSIASLWYNYIHNMLCYGHGGNDMKDMWRRLPLKKKIVVLLTLLCIGLTIGYLPEPYPPCPDERGN